VGQAATGPAAFVAVTGVAAVGSAQFGGADDFDLGWLAGALPADRAWFAPGAVSFAPATSGTILQRYWRLAQAEWPA
jgi:hypothetical protein